ncbi:HNH endonuclease [Bacillus sp. AK031]
MKNTLDYILNFKKLVTVKELQKDLKSPQSTIYSMARGEKPIPEKIQERLSKIFNIKKEFWGRDLIPPAFADFFLEEYNLNDLEKEIIEYARNNSVSEAYSRSVGLQPASATNKVAQKNLKLTIYKRAPEELITSFIPSKTKREYLKKISNGKGFYVWGVRSGVYNQWTKLSRGDHVMFASKGNFFLWGTVVITLHSPDLARQLWPDSDDESFEYIYIMAEVNKMSFDVVDFNKLLGYSLNNRVQGFQVLDMEKSKKIINACGFDSNLIQPWLNKKSFEQEIDWLEKQSSLDTNRNQKGRIEQAYLRSYLFGNKTTGECCICKREFPLSGLITAHIKKRSECTIEEKKDVNVVAPMCRSCDIWFENGYISVNTAGNIVCINDNQTDKVVTGDLLDELSNIQGKRCSYWKEENKKYFHWHFVFHGFDNLISS